VYQSTWQLTAFTKDPFPTPTPSNPNPTADIHVEMLAKSPVPKLPGCLFGFIQLLVPRSWLLSTLRKVNSCNGNIYNSNDPSPTPTPRPTRPIEASASTGAAGTAPALTPTPTHVARESWLLYDEMAKKKDWPIDEV
jgi:hypothetical protein